MSDIVKGYTPGPWKWERVRTSCGFCFRVGPLAISDGKVNHACIYADYPGQMALELAEANARLIAAAPDMATELTTLRGEVERLRAALRWYAGPEAIHLYGFDVGHTARAALQETKNAD